jgi:hypothetical protein
MAPLESAPMKTKIINRSEKKIIHLLLALIILSFGALHEICAQKKDIAQQFDIKAASFLLPQPLPAGKYSHQIAIYYVVPPKDWTLDIVKAPMFNYTGKYTLPKGFNIQGGISTLVVSNRFNLGPFWNYSINNFHLGVGYQIAYNLGVLKSFGFHTIFSGWEHQPSVTVGYNFARTAVTFRGDLYYTTALYLSEGGYTVSSADPFMNGYSLTGSFEQRLHKKRVMSLGLKINYMRYHIIAWPALPVNSYRYFIPEFQVGLNF